MSAEVLRRAASGYKPFLGQAPLSAEDRADLQQRTLEDIKASGPVVAPASAPLSPDAPPDTYPEFLAWAFKFGAVRPVDMKAAAELWQQHRKNLAVA